MTYFYDSTVIADIPRQATHLTAYHDGLYATTTGKIVRALPNVQYVRWYTVLGDPTCGLADFEPGNQVFDQPGALRKWALMRHDMQKGTPIVYTDRDNAAEALIRLDGLRTYFLIATLDNKEWTAAELAANMATGDNGTVPPALIPPGRIWGNQFHTQRDPTYDQGILFLGWWL